MFNIATLPASELTEGQATDLLFDGFRALARDGKTGMGEVRGFAVYVGEKMAFDGETVQYVAVGKDGEWWACALCDEFDL